ncbi:MAG TPA: flagellar biosynthesis protein FliQ [Firmicutes bacterium]|jgi:flagellar biosynthetic protein FliQ|nr:flagellar biosynthesis protein FliQ [Bacillota bacterium]
MTPEFVIDLGREAVMTSLLVAGPLLLSGLAIGLLVSILQAATQIQEATLSFVPKILAVMLAALLFAPWMMTVLTDFASRLFGNLASVIG